MKLKSEGFQLVKPNKGNQPKYQVGVKSGRKCNSSNLVPDFWIAKQSELSNQNGISELCRYAILMAP